MSFPFPGLPPPPPPPAAMDDDDDDENTEERAAPPASKKRPRGGDSPASETGKKARKRPYSRKPLKEKGLCSI